MRRYVLLFHIYARGEFFMNLIKTIDVFEGEESEKINEKIDKIFKEINLFLKEEDEGKSKIEKFIYKSNREIYKVKLQNIIPC